MNKIYEVKFSSFYKFSLLFYTLFIIIPCKNILIAYLIEKMYLIKLENDFEIIKKN